MTLIDVNHLCEIAEVEFDDIVLETYVPDLNELRIIIQDSSCARQLMARFIAMITLPINDGNQFLHSHIIFTMAVRIMSLKAILAPNQKTLCENF